jgi:hypothetical protein
MSSPPLASAARTAAVQFMADHPKTMLWIALAGWLVAGLEAFKVF